MGVSITGHQYIKHLPGHIESDEDYENEIYEAFAYREFPHALEGMLVTERDDTFLTAGHFQVSGDEEYVSFSYSGYNHIRNIISEVYLGAPAKDVFANYEEFAGKPLYELVDFADNEGTLGPRACQKIYDAFVAGGEEKKRQVREMESPWNTSRLDDLIKTFEIAAGTGMVSFF